MSKPSDIGFAARKKSYDALVAKVAAGGTLQPSELTAMARFEVELAESGLDIPDTFTRVEDVEAYSGYKKRTIYNAVKSGELKRKSDSSFDRADVDAWLRTKGRDPQVGKVQVPYDEENDAAEGEFSSKKEEAKYRHFRALREEILVRQLEGDLIPRDLVSQQQVARAHEFKTALLLLNRRVSHKIAAIAGVESRLVDDILDEEAKLLLTSICRKVEIYVD